MQIFRSHFGSFFCASNFTIPFPQCFTTQLLIKLTKLKRQHVKLKYLEDIKQLVIKNTFNRRNHQKADKQYKDTHKGALK